MSTVRSYRDSISADKTLAYRNTCVSPCLESICATKDVKAWIRMPTSQNDKSSLWRSFELTFGVDEHHVYRGNPSAQSLNKDRI